MATSQITPDDFMAQNQRPPLTPDDFMTQQAKPRSSILGMERLGGTAPPIAPVTPPGELETPEQLKQRKIAANAPSFINPRTGWRYFGEERGTGPLAVLDMPTEGMQEIGEGVSQMAEPEMREKAGGAHKIIGGVFKAAAPLMAGAAVSAPLATAASLGVGMGAQTATEKGLTAAGVPPEYSALAGDVAGVAVGGITGAKLHARGAGPKPSPIPDSPDTLKIQVDQLASGQRKAVLVTPTSTESPTPPPGFKTVDTKDGTLIYNPRLTNARTLKRASVFGKLNEVLGPTEGGMGPESTEEIQASGKPPVAVIAKTPDGTPVQETLATPDTVPQVTAQTQKVTPPDSTITTTAPDQAITDRIGNLVKEGVDVQRGSSTRVPLSPLGEEQARQFAQEEAAKGGFDKIETSDSLRAQQTTAPIAQLNPNVPVIPNKNLESRGLGSLEGQPMEAIQSDLDRLDENQNEVPPGQGPLTDRPGESREQFRARVFPEVLRNMEELSRNPDQRILMMGHTQGAKELRGWIKNGTPDDFSVDDAAAKEAAEDPATVERIWPNEQTGKWDITSGDDGEPGLYYGRHATTAINKENYEIPSGERGAISGDLATLGLGKVVQEDLRPKAQEIGQRLFGAVDNIVKTMSAASRGQQAAEAHGALREMGGKLVQAKAEAYHATEDARNYFERQQPETNFSFVNKVETGQIESLPPEQQDIAGTIRALYDNAAEGLKERGLLDTYIENYFTHAYKDPAKASDWIKSWMQKRPMAGAESFRRQRTFPTLDEARAAGLVPKYTNPVDYVLDYIGQAERSMAAHDVRDEWLSNGDLTFVRAGEKPPPNTLPLNDKIFTSYGPKQGAVGLPEDANVGPGDVTVYGRREMGKYYAPEPMATVFNNRFGEGLGGNPAYQFWMGTNNALNRIQLTASWYHGLTTALNSGISDMALGLREVASGKLLTGAVDFAKGVTPFASFVEDMLKGTDILKAWRGQIPAEGPTAAVVEALKLAGADFDQYRPEQWSKMKAAFQRFGSQGEVADVWRGVARSPFALLEKAMAPIMQYAVPRAKASAFSKILSFELDQNPDLFDSKTDARAVTQRIWNSIDNRFGQFIYSNLSMNRMARDVMMATVGRPGWNLGTVREVGGGAYDFAKMVNDIGHLRGPELTDRTAYTAALVIGTMIWNGLLTAMLTRSAPTGMDYVAFRTGGTNEDGRPARDILPTYLAKDIMSYAQRPLATVKAKAAPAIAIGSDLLQNKNFRGEWIYGEGGTGLVPYLKSAVTPYSIQGIQKSLERGEPIGKSLLPMVGIMPAGKRVGQSAAERLMSQYRDEDRPSVHPAEKERNRIKNQITNAIRAGDVERAGKLADGAVAAGKITGDENDPNNDVYHAFQRAQTSPLEADFHQLDLSRAFNVLAVATPEEKEIIGPILADKLARQIDTKPRAEHDALVQKALKIPELAEFAREHFHATQ